MKDKELMNLGFGVYIHKADVLGIYNVNRKSTLKKMTSKTNAPFPNQVLNNLNGRECLTYVETPFHIYLCAFPIEVMLEEYSGDKTEEGLKIRETIESEDYVAKVLSKESDSYYSLYMKKVGAAKEAAKKEWLELQAKRAGTEDDNE